MIWNSVLIMTAVDIVMIVVTVLVLSAVRPHWSRLTDARAALGARLMVGGVIVLGLFYAADLTTMYLLPALFSPAVGIAAMETLHLSLAWIVIPAGIASTCVGFTVLVKRVVGLSVRLESTDEELSIEHEARQIAEESLRRTEAVLTDALSAARTGMWAWDIETNQVTWSDEIEPLFGMRRGEFEGTFEAYADLIHPEDRGALESAIQDALEGLRRYDVCHRVIWPDGSIHWIEGKGQVYRAEDGRPVRMTGTGTDVTERKNAELVQEALNRRVGRMQQLESLGVLAGGVAHDFNNIFVSLIGHADLALMDTPSDSPARQHIEELHTSALRASELTNQLLAYSGKGQFRLESLDLNRVVEENVPLLHSSLPKRARLALKLEAENTAVFGDVAQIRQVLVNLVTNAGEALDGPQGTVTIRTAVIDADRAFLASGASEAELAEGRYVLLEVADDGVGMDDETRAKVFDPFFSTRFTGRGLGLAAVLGIMHGHHGTVRVTSQPGTGTGVQILFPESSTLPVSAKPDLLREPRSESDTPRGVVLVVDDEEPVRRVAQATLERAGFSVVTAKDGRDGLERFRERRGDIVAILLDATMPVMGGEETLREIRGLDDRVPVVFTSGYSERQLGAELGGTDSLRFLPKPFRPQSLVEEIRAATSGSPVVGD